MLGLVVLRSAASQLRKYSLPRRHGCLRLCEAIDEAAGVSRDRSEAGASRYVQSGRDQRIRPPHAGEAENQRVGLIRFRGAGPECRESTRSLTRFKASSSSHLALPHWQNSKPGPAEPASCKAQSPPTQSATKP